MRAFATTVLALSLATISLPAAAEVYHFSLVIVPPPAAETPKVKRIGELVVNGKLRLPAYQVTVVDGSADSGWTTTAPVTLKDESRAKLVAAQAARLAAYYTPAGWMLVPRDWKLLAGGVGADGSKAITFVPPSGKGYLSFYDASACRGCAETPASLFFPEARADAKRDEYTVYEKSATPLKITRFNRNVLMYRTVVDGQPIDGVAEYDGASDLPFHKYEVSLPSAQRDLARPILNWFLRVPESAG